MANETIWETPAAGGPGKRPEPEDSPPVPWDPNEYRAMVCRRCDRPRVFRRSRINHSFHFMLALGTLGVWLPVWGIIIIVHAFKPWTCIFCGVRQLKS